MNFCITGGAGFIGSGAARFFRDAGHAVHIIDNLSTGSIRNIEDIIDEKQVVFHEGDVRDSEFINSVFSRYAPDACLNLAAQVSVPASMEDPRLTEEVNVGGLLNLLGAGARTGLKVFVHASSAAVYGDGPILPKTEEMVPEPKSPYAVSKITGEYYTAFFARHRGFRAVNCRFFNVFGPRQDPASQYAAAVPIFITRALNNDDITIYGDGEQTRDFIFVDDLVNAINYLVENSGMPVITANCGYGSHITINELASKIIAETGSRSRIVYEPERPGDIKYSYASTEPLQKLGWEPLSGFDKGLSRTIAWYREHISG